MVLRRCCACLRRHRLLAISPEDRREIGVYGCGFLLLLFWWIRRIPARPYGREMKLRKEMWKKWSKRYYSEVHARIMGGNKSGLIFILREPTFRIRRKFRNYNWHSTIICKCFQGAAGENGGVVPERHTTPLLIVPMITGCNTDIEKCFVAVSE